MTEKILARAAGLDEVRPGDVITAGVDVLTVPDAERFIDFFNEHELKVWNPDRIVFCFDHYFENWLPSAAVREHPKIYAFARSQGIPEANVYGLGREGLSHQVPVEEGWVLPGTVSLGTDTQSATMGAMNCFSMPTLSSGSIGVALTGLLWQFVPECVSLRFTGRPRRGVLGKDVVFHLIAAVGGAIGGRVIEVSGPGLEHMPVDLRMAVANGSIQLHAQAMVFSADATLLQYLKPRARAPFAPVEADPGAGYAAAYECDLSELECLISGPHDIDLIRSLRELAGLPVTAANIGSCSAGRLEDLRLAAEVLQGQEVHPSVRLTVTPISATVARQAAEEGLIAVFERAGATVTHPGCGACYHGNQSPLKLAGEERCVTTSVENLRGRMGSDSAEIYLGNAAVVAASAVTGELTDPGRFLGPQGS